MRSRGTRAAPRPHQVLLKRQVGKALSALRLPVRVNMESGHRSRSPGATRGGLRSKHAPRPPLREEQTSARGAGERQTPSKAGPGRPASGAPAVPTSRDSYLPRAAPSEAAQAHWRM